MNARTVLSAFLLGGMLPTEAAQATLYDLSGGLIYSDVLKITWLPDAIYSKALLGCVTYMVVIILLGHCVGFNKLEDDK